MKLVLIGGRSDSDNNIIDQKIVSLCEKDHPIFLFIGLASTHSDSKYDEMKKIYKDLSCECQYLKRKNLIHNPDLALNKISNADIIYFCGGDTIKLLNDISFFQLEKPLKDAFNRGCILVGNSAGAILLSKEGFSDSYILRGEKDSYEFVHGLGFSNISICPHYLENSSKDEQLKKIILDSHKKVYCLEADSSLIIIDDQIESFSSVYLLSESDGSIHKECV